MRSRNKAYNDGYKAGYQAGLTEYYLCSLKMADAIFNKRRYDSVILSRKSALKVFTKLLERFKANAKREDGQ